MHEEVMVAVEVMEEIEEGEYSIKKMWNVINITNLDTFSLNVQVVRIMQTMLNLMRKINYFPWLKNLLLQMLKKKHGY